MKYISFLLYQLTLISRQYNLRGLMARKSRGQKLYSFDLILPETILASLQRKLYLYIQCRIYIQCMNFLNSLAFLTEYL